MISIYSRLVEHLLRRRVLRPERVDRDVLVLEAGEQLRLLELQNPTLLQIRPEAGKIVYACRNDVFGEVVLKYVSPMAPAGDASAFGRTMRTVRTVNTGLFPEVFLVGETFSVEAHVYGKGLDELSAREWESVDLVAFFRSVRDFAVREVDQQWMAPQELRRLISYYVKKSLKPSRRARPLRRLRGLHALLRAGDRLAQLTAASTRDLHRVRVPRTRMIDDMGAHNVLRCSNTDQLLIVDAEYLRKGFWGFDCVWLLATLGSFSCPPSQLIAAYHNLCQDDFLGGVGTGGLMRSVLALMLEIRSVGRDRFQRELGIHQLRGRVLGDIAESYERCRH